MSKINKQQLMDMINNNQDVTNIDVSGIIDMSFLCRGNP